MLTKRMAMRRMNEMWRGMALTLVFCVLLFHTCQGESTQFSTSATSTTRSFTGVPENTQASNNDSTDLSSTNSTDLAYQGVSSQFSTSATSTITNYPNVPENTQTSSKGSTDLSIAKSMNLTTTLANKVNDHADSIPQVSEELQNNNTLQRSPKMQTDTSTTKEPAQESLVTSKTTTTQIVVHDLSEADAKGSTMESVEPNNETKQVKETSKEENKGSPPQGNSKNVFVPILVCGLILAAALIGMYVKRNHCPTSARGGIKLADESCMADEDNQGNTLVSVAPLNPPENQEKPSLNGESLEAVKIQNPPAATNGHSTAKADTEL
ncbi:uncharacterized protein cd34 isoform X2 [Clarias gariepinus]|uniref:uncharacterized protein cd34 isoform X2 n=1 Tax=Clarias gariepinus TaxID=13013 RepID=UPI00234DCCDA|nr:uncharacterized protein cd34 isoform X2 [Clarias gariepinus]